MPDNPTERQQIAEAAGRWESRLVALAMDQVEGTADCRPTLAAACQLLEQEPAGIVAVIVASLAVDAAIAMRLMAAREGSNVDEVIAWLADTAHEAGT